MTLGNKIRKTREKLGICQMQLAVKANVALDTIQYYEKDIRAPSIEALKAMSEALHVKVEYLSMPDQTGVTWEDLYESTKCLQLNKNVRLTLTRVSGVLEPEYAAQLDIHMKWGDVRKEWTLVPNDLPDTWETMQDLAEDAAQLYLSELFDNIAPVLQILEDR